MRSAIVGLGRSGWNNHVRAMLALPDRFRITSVADSDPDRRAQAEREIGCRAYPDLDALLGYDRKAELVVVATPTYSHLPDAVHALAASKMVVCEKPIASDIGEADQIMAAASAAGKLLTVFSNYRFECDFLTIRKVLDSGVLGDLLTLRISADRWGRRRDWQTLSRLGGGALRNTGWHLIDQALLLSGAGSAPTRLVAQVARGLSPGDAEDYVKVALKGDGLPMIDIQVSDISPFPQDVWLVTGTRGSLVGSHHKLRWAYVKGGELEPLTVATGAAPRREYRFDSVPLREECWQAPAQRPSAAVAFYGKLYDTIRHSAPLAVTPRSARRVMEVIDQCLGAVDAAPRANAFSRRKRPR